MQGTPSGREAGSRAWERGVIPIGFQMVGKGSWLRTHPTFVEGREGVGQGGQPDETNLSARMRVSTQHTPRDPKSSKCSHVFAFGEAVTRSRAEL